MRIETITAEEGFAALRSDWDELASQAVEPSVFLTFDWFSAAWAWRRHDAELRVLVARENDASIAILPLVARVNGRRREWTLLTVPDTQHCDLIAVASTATSVCPAFANALRSRNDWDILILDYLATDGLIARHLLPALRANGVRSIVEDRGRNLHIRLDASWDAYWASRSRSLKKACNLAINRFEQSGVIRIERIGPGTVSDAECARMIAEVVDISRRSWKQTTGNSLDRDAPGDFIRALSLAAHRNGWLSVWLAYLDERPVAMEYQLVYDGNVHALRSDFDAMLDHVSPGSFLFRHLLERLFGERRSQYLMGPGDNAYKTRWTTEGHPLRRVIGYNGSVYGRVAYWIDQRAKPLLRPFRDRLRSIGDPGRPLAKSRK